MRKLYKGKHDLLIQCLKIFKDKVAIEGENGGLHLVLHFLIDASEMDLIEAAAKQSIKLYGLGEHYIIKPEPSSAPSILLGYANIPEDRIQAGITALYEAIKDYL